MRAVAVEPGKRLETAEQWLLEMEAGDQRPLINRSQPLLERHPLVFWRWVAAASLAANLVLLVQWLSS